MDARRRPEIVRLGDQFLRVYQHTLLGAAVVVAWAGALTAPAHLSAVFAPAVGALTAALVALGAAALGLGRPSARTLVLSGLAGLLVVPFVSGASLFGSMGAALLMALLMTGASLLARVAAAASPQAGSAARDEATRLRLGLPGVPLPEVLRHWERTGRQLDGTGGPEARAAAAELRSLLLDELSRRDPAGVERWLRSGDDDPRRHLPSGGAERAV